MNSTLGNKTESSLDSGLRNGSIGTRSNDESEKAVKKPVKKAPKKERNSALKNHLKYLVPEMKLALIRETGVKPIAIKSAGCVGQFVEPMRHYSEEHFIAFHLDCRFHVIGFHEVSHGTLNASLVHPREVFKAALLANSYAIIVAHNHPGGIETPSKEDIETTKQLIAAGELLGVMVLDHVIVTATGLGSLRENYPELWF